MAVAGALVFDKHSLFHIVTPLLLIYTVTIPSFIYIVMLFSLIYDVNSAPHGWLSGGCEFDTRLTFFPAYFRLSPLLNHVRKVVGGFGKKSLCEYWCEKN